jgi:hypothetical protein
MWPMDAPVTERRRTASAGRTTQSRHHILASRHMIGMIGGLVPAVEWDVPVLGRSRHALATTLSFPSPVGAARTQRTMAGVESCPGRASRFPHSAIATCRRARWSIVASICSPGSPRSSFASDERMRTLGAQMGR